MDAQQRFRRKAEEIETMQHQQTKKRVKRTVFYVCLLVFIVAAFLLLCYTVFFKVRAFSVTGNSRYSAETVTEHTGVSVGDTLYSFSADDVRQKLLKELPYISDVEINRKLPSTLEITVIEEKPVMFAEILGEDYLISSDMTVLERSDEPQTDGLIRVDAGDVRKCFTGDPLIYTDTKMAGVIQELYAVLEHYKLADKMTAFSIADRFDISAVYDGRIEIYFGDIENIDIKIRFFIGILEHLYDDDKGKLDISNIKEASFRRENE